MGSEQGLVFNPKFGLPRELLAFAHWWKKDPERAKCTLEQAIGAYIGTYPGRTIPLLLDLIKEFVDE
jgi:hypothetical protein